MTQQKTFFLVIGLPTFIFFFFLVSQVYFIMSVFLIAFFLVFLVGFCLQKKDVWLRLTKMGVLLFLIFFLLFPNPVDWNNQLSRRIDRHQLITPNDPKIAMLSENFYSRYGSEFSDLDEASQVVLVQSYILRIIDYSYDYFAPSRYAFDHLATVDEILNNDATHGTDDCDGIAIVTCSLLIYMGYDAFIAEGDFHWWTVVFTEGTRDWYRGKTVQLNWWPALGYPYYIFNEEILMITQPVAQSIISVLTDPYWIGFYYDYFQIYFIAIFLGLSTLMQYILIIPRRWKFKKRDLAEILFGWVYLSIVGTSLLLFQFWFTFVAGPLVFASLAIILFIMDRKLPEKVPGFKKFCNE